jgi:predicted cobalt transporter CbtA
MLEKLITLSKSHGPLRKGEGMITGVIALSLSILCFLGVLAFHFPQYLTTPELRQSYDVSVIRQVMFISLIIAGSLSLVNILFNRSRWLATSAFILVVHD